MDPPVASFDDSLEDRLVAGIGIVLSWPMNHEVRNTNLFIGIDGFGELCGRPKT